MICDDIGSIIVTIAIHCHGTVIQLDLPYQRQRVFRNVRLFSKAGGFDPVYVRLAQDRGPDDLRELTNLFAKDLNDFTVDLVNEYVKGEKSIYQTFLKKENTFSSYPEEKVENVCQTFHNVTFDKSLSPNESGFNCVLRYIFPEIAGIFIISIHEKTHPNTYRLLYPKTNTEPENLLNLFDLKDFRAFASIFGRELPDLNYMSSDLNVENIYSRLDRINKDRNLNQKEKEDSIKQLYNDYYYNTIDKWNITIRGDKITDIRLSYLVGLIKELIGDKCKMNVFDYTCNHITETLPESQRGYEKYVVSADIENPSENWGGRRRVYRKNKYRRKTRKGKVIKKRIHKTSKRLKK